MDELEKALAAYLKAGFGPGEVVTVKRLRNEVASQFITPTLTLSEALSGVARFVRDMVEERLLLRVGPGEYSYWPERNALPVPSDSSGFTLARGRIETQLTLATYLRESVKPEFASVAALARSKHFLVQGDLATIDLRALQGVSF